MKQENPFYTRKHSEIKRITNVPDRATARRGGAQLVTHKDFHPTDTIHSDSGLFKLWHHVLL
jgi:hypothetical protein